MQVLTMRRGTILILGYRVEGQGQLWHSVYNTLLARYRLQFFVPITFKLNMQVVDNERSNPIDFEFRGKKVRDNFGPQYKTLLAWYRLQFLSIHFQTVHACCEWWEEEPCWFLVTWLKVKVNFGTLCIKPSGHDTDYSFCPITFKLHMHIIYDERRNLAG